MATDTAIRDHQAWLGYLQPDGLVVSPSALVDSQVYLDKNTIELQRRFLEQVKDLQDSDDKTRTSIVDFPAMLRDFLGWPGECLCMFSDEKPAPDALTSPLPEYGETLAPSFAFRDERLTDPAGGWMILGKILAESESLDAVRAGQERTWAVSETRRFERLLRETGVPIGILTNLTEIRLIYAPRGENAGNITFPVQAMTEVAGRPILAALHMQLCGFRLLNGPPEYRLPAILKRSRDYQSTVSTELSRQVLDALYEMVRGFQSADAYTQRELLARVLNENPNDVYAGLLTVLMRLVFLLYAEDRGLMPTSSLYIGNYSAHGLFEKLRADNERFPDTMDHRYGAWARLLALFRAVYGGCGHRDMKMPARKGYLFDPQRYPFLEGRTTKENRLPLVSDGVVFRVLNNLLILRGERLSYRTLDVEQIGSVYETMMGFRIELTNAQSIALKPAKRKGAPSVIDLDACLAQKPGDRVAWIAEQSEQTISGKAAEALKEAGSIDDILAAIERKIARNATPQPVPAGTMILQPSDERRRSGSHYTPRSLTEPIVRTTLKPILERLGEKPTPAQILDLKIADIAVGSGAFLVEACRQLGDELLKAWHNHGEKPPIPPDEDEVLFARRKIAQRCLYGVDRNPMAVDLAKLSLWLATLAKDHPFTFLDHSIRCGDSLVGLIKTQIAEFHWEPGQNRVWGQDDIERRIEAATRARKELIEADEDFVSPELKAQRLKTADEHLNYVRKLGDCVIAAFFAGKNKKEREEKRNALLGQVTEFYRSWKLELSPDAVVKELRSGKFPVVPFHWGIEFPEVFGRGNGGGFDGIVGNPPFLRGRSISGYYGDIYLQYLQSAFPGAGGQADYVVYFFRAALSRVHDMGAFGLVATKTISQGDSRASGLGWISRHGGTVYAAIRQVDWPGDAAVAVSYVFICKGTLPGPHFLDGRPVRRISAYLFPQGPDEEPAQLCANAERCYKAVDTGGMHFVFDSHNHKAYPVCLLKSILANEPDSAQVVRPFIGGDEILTHSDHHHDRFVIDFGEKSLSEAEKHPSLLALVEQGARKPRIGKWWWFHRRRPEMTAALEGMSRYLARPYVSTYSAFVFLPAGTILSSPHCAFAYDSYNPFSILQSRIHECFIAFLGPTLEDRPVYTPSDCFETFPFPRNFESNPHLESIGQSYYDFRAALMIRNNEGLTKTYNRFHDRDHDGTGIEGRSPADVIADTNQLRDLHAAMDRAVLDAYGWVDIDTKCEFILDYDDEETGDDDSVSKRKRKKPWRYRWPDEVHDEVLARLLALNAERAEEERLAAAAEKPIAQKSKKNRGNRKDQSIKPDATPTDLFSQ
jgi:hypothetical protein